MAFELDIFLLLGRKFSCSNQHFFPLKFCLIHENIHYIYNCSMLLGYFHANLCIIPLCLFWKFVTCYWVHVPVESNTNSVIDCITEGNTTLKCQYSICILSDFFLLFFFLLLWSQQWKNLTGSHFKKHRVQRSIQSIRNMVWSVSFLYPLFWSWKSSPLICCHRKPVSQLFFYMKKKQYFFPLHFKSNTTCFVHIYLWR